jgi:hypothetical protein
MPNVSVCSDGRNLPMQSKNLVRSRPLRHLLRFQRRDDDGNFLFLTHHLVAHAFWGSSIASFSNAGDALNHILNTGTDFLSTDHAMGSMSGTNSGTAEETTCHSDYHGFR